jgi:hypothetical protein
MDYKLVKVYIINIALNLKKNYNHIFLYYILNFYHLILYAIV